MRPGRAIGHHGRISPARTLRVTDRSRVRRKTDRASYDWATLVDVLDEALICHVGFAIDGRPWVMPTAFARVGDAVVLHGAAGNFALKSLAAGTEACLTFTLLDGLVLARSAFHHSMNYRSVMLFGRAEQVTDPGAKRDALLAIVDHMEPGRSRATRAPTAEELRATLVVRVPIDEGSAKVRTGPPIDDPEDYRLHHWAGVVPIHTIRGEPEADSTPPPG